MEFKAVIIYEENCTTMHFNVSKILIENGFIYIKVDYIQFSYKLSEVKNIEFVCSDIRTKPIEH